MHCVLRQYTNANAIKITTERMFQLKLETMSNDTHKIVVRAIKQNVQQQRRAQINRVIIEMGASH